jgi:hypothetical protein
MAASADARKKEGACVNHRGLRFHWLLFLDQLAAAAQRWFEAGTPYKPTCYEPVLLIALGALGAESFEVLDGATIVVTVPLVVVCPIGWTSRFLV